MKILLVEDELKMASSIKQGLEENGYIVELATDGYLALQMVSRNSYTLIITDLLMPVMDGLSFIQLLRKGGNTVPVIMLTALGTTEDKLKGFAAGTDDYMVKPFEFEELLARIRAVIKRAKPEANDQHILRFADLTMDLDSRLVERGGKKINMTAKEFALLEYLIRNQGKVVSKVDIAEKIWDIHFDTGTNVIEVYVSYLRNKIDKDFPVKLIHTRIGMGYVLRTE
ncbi:MAG TPA: response regulator transcription factor [Catalimonadaceae bacterium]|jgi:two-component system copper resistance phosphate regulon response regulator CusR|nr:response regulator transcription factor [Catalimonadaceae bacterium]